MRAKAYATSIAVVVVAATLLTLDLLACSLLPGRAGARDEVESGRGFSAAAAGDLRSWAHDSIGVTAPASTWYLAEGCTAGDFETWLLIQNPGEEEVEVEVDLLTAEGVSPGPSVTMPPRSRRGFDLGDYVTSFDVSSKVTATGGEIICERAMYGSGRSWAHDSIGVTAPASTWYLAEGCTAGDFETWLLIQNPGEE
ncbi:MAG: hypothetical protein SWK76_03480, partial [Actinomycetota bacterium]|nr:hypothetical protein [Actinomycetota bacterium]